MWVTYVRTRTPGCVSPGIQIVLLPIIRGLLVERQAALRHARVTNYRHRPGSAANPVSPVSIAIRSARLAPSLARSSYAIRPGYQSLCIGRCVVRPDLIARWKLATEGRPAKKRILFVCQAAHVSIISGVDHRERFDSP